MSKKVVLAYSGGLDTSIMISWLKENYDLEVIAVVCDLGQDEDFDELKQKAIKSGAAKAFVVDVKEEFIKDYIVPLIKASAIYENQYLLGTISRPLIAKKMIEVAKKEGAEAVSHGATGKGNDQVRFELSIKVLAPDLKIIVPWRMWNITSRTEAMDYAIKHNIPVPTTKKSPYSRDFNIWYMSHEGGVLEDITEEKPDDLCQITQSIEKASNKAEYVEIEFVKGNPTTINGQRLDSVTLLNTLNKLASKHGIGVTDMIENRVVGMKARGVYEVPGGTILYKAHQILESICIDRDTLHYKQKVAIDYANLIYNGMWLAHLKKHWMDL